MKPGRKKIKNTGGKAAAKDGVIKNPVAKATVTKPAAITSAKMPVKPAKPVKPVKPVEPAGPIRPVKPVKPIKPTVPIKPNVPIEPWSATFEIDPEMLEGLRPGVLTHVLGFKAPANDVERLSASAPLTLLPVRIETVFSGTPNPTILRLRIYPDQIHVDGHDPDLNTDEIAAGRKFWNLWSAAAADEAAQAAAMDWFSDLLPERRAAFVAERTRPGKSVLPGQGGTKRLTRAVCLPKAWRIVGYKRDADGGLSVGFSRTGGAIPHDLCMDVIGTDPYDTKAEASRNSAWLHDYATAKKFGMGVDITLTGNADWIKTDGIALLMVYGVSGPASEAQAQALNDLIAAHRFSDGMAFQTQGVPTNSVNDTRSGLRPHPASPDGTLRTVVDDTGGAPDPLGNGTRLSHVLGLGPISPLNRLDGADRDEDTPQAFMNEALWPVTWGAYFDELTSDDLDRPRIAAGIRDRARTEFLDNVRGAGPLPALRVGAQPYGVLPVRAHSVPQAWTDAEPWYELFLTQMRDVWLDATPRIAKLSPGGGQSRAEVLGDVVRVLGGLPHPSRFLVRRLKDWRRVSHDSGWADLLALFGLFFLAGDDPIYDADSRSIMGQWGWSKDVLGAGQFGLGVSPTKLRALDSSSLLSTGAQLDELRDLRRRLTTFLPDRTKHSQARTWIDYMIRQVEAHETRLEPLRGFNNLPLGISGVLRNGSVDPKIAFHLYDTSVRELTQVLVAGASVDGAMPAQPELYIRALADQVVNDTQASRPRLTAAPLGAPTGLTLTRRVTSAFTVKSTASQGAKAALSAARPPRAVVQPVPAPGVQLAGTRAPVPVRDDSAPLLKQLLTKAVANLPDGQRNSYRRALNGLAELSVAELELQMRETLGLAGDRLDAWLTSLATQRLRDLGTDQVKAQYGGYGFVLDLKPDGGAAEQQGYHLAPSPQHATTTGILRSAWKSHGTADRESPLSVNLTSDRLRLAQDMIEAVASGRMLGDVLGQRFERRLHDAGLDVYLYDLRALVRNIAGDTDRKVAALDGIALMDAAATAKFDSWRRRLKNTDHRTAIRDLVLALRDDFDALGDAALAEATHYAAMGNSARAAAIMDAVTLGEAPPSDLRHARTDIAKSELLHHVLTALPSETPGKSDRGRALSHPALNVLAAQLLPPIDDLQISLMTGVEVTAVPLSGLGLSPLDLVMEAARPGALGLRVLAHLAKAGETLDPGVKQRFGVDTPSRGQWEDFIEVCTALAAHFGALRPLLPEDIGLGAEAGATLDTKTLRATVSAHTDRLWLLTKTLAHGVQRGNRAAMIQDLLALGLQGFAEALPVGAVLFGANNDALIEHAQSVLAAAEKRIRAVRAKMEEKPEGPALTQAMRLLSGGELAAELTLKGVGLPLGAKQSVPVPARAELLDWTAKYAHVRDDLRALSRALDTVDLISGAADKLVFDVAQVTKVRHKVWLGLALPDQGTPGGSSWVVLDGGGAGGLADGTPVTGYLVDSWTERLPDRTATVGAHFQFDAPSSKAPQAILVAMTPNSDTPWTQELLERTLLETVENAQLRAVKVPDIGRFGHHLPAIFVGDGIDAGPQPESEEETGG